MHTKQFYGLCNVRTGYVLYRALVVCPSVVVVIVVVSMKITRSRVLGVYSCCKHNQSVDIGEKLVCTGFKFLKKAY